MVRVNAIMDKMGATTLLACLGAFGIPVPFVASFPSPVAAVLSSSTIGSAGGGDKCEGVPFPDEGLLGYTVVLSSRECIRDIC